MKTSSGMKYRFPIIVYKCQCPLKGESIPKQGGLHLKNMLHVWWDIKGVVSHEVSHQNKNLNVEKYCCQFDALHKILQKIVHHKSVLLLYENSDRVPHERFMALNFKIFPHFLYSTDIALSNYFRYLHTFFFIGRTVYELWRGERWYWVFLCIKTWSVSRRRNQQFVQLVELFYQ